jgi:hypothetical protein
MLSAAHPPQALEQESEMRRKDILSERQKAAAAVKALEQERKQKEETLAQEVRQKTKALTSAWQKEEDERKALEAELAAAMGASVGVADEVSPLSPSLLSRLTSVVRRASSTRPSTL